MNTELMPIIGEIIEKLLEGSSPDNLCHIDYQQLLDYIPNDIDEKEGLLNGVINLLHCLGLIDFSGDNITVTNRNAYFALVSLSLYLKHNTVVVDEPVGPIEKEYLIRLTRSLEEIRFNKKNLPKHEIHERYIVNVIIKSEQVRNGKKQPVYLHKYHKDWQAYHLIGLSRKQSEEEEPADILAAKAMKIHLGLDRDEYEIDRSYNPPEISLPPRVSKTSGVITKYTYHIFSVKRFRDRLRLKEIVEKENLKASSENRVPKLDEKSFRWFTLDEMVKGYSFFGNEKERIMFSSAAIANDPNIDLAGRPVNAPKADDIRPEVDVIKEIGNRITYNYFYIAVVIAILGLLIYKFSPELLEVLGSDSPIIDRLIRIIGISMTAISIGISILRLRS